MFKALLNSVKKPSTYKSTVKKLDALDKQIASLTQSSRALQASISREAELKQLQAQALGQRVHKYDQIGD